MNFRKKEKKMRHYIHRIIVLPTRRGKTYIAKGAKIRKDHLGFMSSAMAINISEEQNSNCGPKGAAKAAKKLIQRSRS